MLSDKILRKNLLAISITFFITVFILINVWRPGLLYNVDGSIKQFGLGRKNKTVIPIWLVVIILAIVCYLAATSLYFLNTRR